MEKKLEFLISGRNTLGLDRVARRVDTRKGAELGGNLVKCHEFGHFWSPFGAIAVWAVWGDVSHGRHCNLALHCGISPGTDGLYGIDRHNHQLFSSTERDSEIGVNLKVLSIT